MVALSRAGYGATCSLGAATGADVVETLRIADQTLYRAKDAGKSVWVFERAPAEELGSLGAKALSERAKHATRRL